jgi:ankyrin repeat protein
MSINGMTPAHRFAGLAVVIGIVGSGVPIEAQEPPDENALNLIVMIDANLDGESSVGAGLVFGVEADRLSIATANHVVRRGGRAATSLQLRFRNHRGPVAARLAPQADSQMDLAVVIVEDARKKGLEICDFATDRLGDPDALSKGDGVYPVGYPNAVEWSMPLSADRFLTVRDQLISFQSPFIGKGYSGGGLFADDQTLIGMIQKDAPPFGVARHIRAVMDVLRRWGYPVGLHHGGAPHAAARKGDVTALKSLLAGGGCSVTTRIDEDGLTPLLSAADEGQVAAVALLLEYGADPNGSGAVGKSPLYLAAGATAVGADEVVRRLLAAGAEVNRAGADGETPLHAASARSVDMVARLLKAGANINRATASGETPLIWAISAHRVDTLTALLAAKANPNAKRQNGQSPLHMAITENGRSPSAWRTTETVGMVRALLKGGADPNWSTAQYTPPLLAMLDLLRQQYRDYQYRGNPAFGRIEIYIEHAAELVQLLVGAGANPSGAWKDARGQLRFALTPVVGDANFRAADTWDLARAQLARVLLRAGADASRKENGSLAGFAVRTGDHGLLKAVIAGRADLNWGVESDHVPLFVAIAQQDTEAARLLIDAGADLNKPDIFGRSPLKQAREKGDHNMVKLLVARGARE